MISSPKLSLAHNHSTGKSVFLRILLILVLHAKKPVVFQDKPGSVVLFSQRGVKIASVSDASGFISFYGTNDSRVWALVDSTSTLEMPDPDLYDHMRPVFIIQTPSLSRKQTSWISKVLVLPFVFKPWRLEELVAAYVHCHYSFTPERNLIVISLFLVGSCKTFLPLKAKLLRFSADLHPLPAIFTMSSTILMETSTNDGWRRRSRSPPNLSAQCVMRRLAETIPRRPTSFLPCSLRATASKWVGITGSTFRLARYSALYTDALTFPPTGRLINCIDTSPGLGTI